MMRCVQLTLGVLGLVLLGAVASGCKPRAAGTATLRAADDETEAGPASAGTATYTGHADYRLVFVNVRTPSFDPNQDLLSTSAASAVAEQVTHAMRSAAMKSLVPILGVVTKNLTGTEPPLMESLNAMATNAGEALKEELKPILAANASNFPVVSETLLIPWLTPLTDNFYDAEKVSMSGTEVANVLGVTPGDPGFPAKLSGEIKSMQKKLYAETKGPLFLLAARQFLFVMPGKSRLTLRVLIGLKPLTAPFTQEDARVKFQKVVIPDIPQRGVVASLTFDVDLEGGAEPALHIDFGDFDKYDKGNFAVVPTGLNKTAPRLEGQANKTGTSWIALNFNFQSLDFKLRSAQLAGIRTLISPGLRIGGANWVVGALKVESVNQSFQTEINNTIDAEIKKAISGANDKLFGGMMSKAILEKAFSTIFGRGEAGT